MLTNEIMLFYYVAHLMIYAALVFISRDILMSLVKSLCLVFVSSEFWEIPIFLLAYLGVPGYGFPEVINHVLVIGIAFILMRLIAFQLDWFSVIIPGAVLIFNYLFLICYPGIISAWILRSISLIGLSAVVLRREKNS